MNTSSHLASVAYYLAPVLAQVALAYFAAALILVTRLQDIIGGTASLVFYESYGGTGGPSMVQRTTHHLVNLFEFPVLFYAAVAFAIAADLRDPLLLQLAWAYVAIRWTHTLVHLTFNKLWVRTPVFMLSNLLLLGMWAHFARLAWTPAAA
ncbi:MAG TPA: MAPEG family protein [Burkholderiaceae bacterium]|nr:MAPEG family protein [Burkholderiaceae bacterium]